MRDHGLEGLIYKYLSKNMRGVRYTIGSGSVLGDDDIYTPNTAIQCKDTKNNNYRLNIKDIDRLVINSGRIGKHPVFICRVISEGYKDGIIILYDFIRGESNDANKSVNLTVHESYVVKHFMVSNDIKSYRFACSYDIKNLLDIIEDKEKGDNYGD